MSPRTISLLGLLALLAGLAIIGHATWRIQRLDAESATLDASGRQAGASFVETLQAEHITRQLEAFDRRRAVALARAEARRDRLLAVLLVLGGAIGLASGAAFRRIAAEIEEGRRLAGGGRPGPP